jgi:signal transduction histidine kinase
VRAGHPLPVSFADCNLAAIARIAVHGVCALHGDRVVVHADSPVRGMWNEDQLSRAIWNLCTNAIQFGAGGTAVIVSVKGGPDGAELSVRNEGPPISADEQEKLFRPFSQTRAAIDGHPRGWGLGLTLVWACAEAHGGRVTVRSVAGEGTTFTLRLPNDARPYAIES